MVSENDVKQEISRKDFKNPILYQALLDNYILKEPAQSITEIDYEKYLIIKEKVGIDERFTKDNKKYEFRKALFRKRNHYKIFNFTSSHILFYYPNLISN